MADLSGPLDPHALSEGKRILALLPVLSAGQSIKRIPLHWEVEAWGCVDTHYNLVVSLQNGVWVSSISVGPDLNASYPPQLGYAPATFHRNSYSCSVAVSGMVGATAGDFGAAPIQLHELEVMCATAAAVARRYNVDTLGKYEDLPAVFTHAEAAIADHYYPGDGDPDSRWDLSEPRPRADGKIPSKPDAQAFAGVIRQRIHEYKVATP